MNATVVAALIAGAVSLLVGGLTGFFAWRTRHTEVNAPDRISEAFSGLVGTLRDEIARLEARQKNADARILKLEQRAREDERTISSLGQQIDWLLSRLRRQDRDEFEALFRPQK